MGGSLSNFGTERMLIAEPTLYTTFMIPDFQCLRDFNYVGPLVSNHAREVFVAQFYCADRLFSIWTDWSLQKQRGVRHKLCGCVGAHGLYTYVPLTFARMVYKVRSRCAHFCQPVGQLPKKSGTGYI